MRGHSILSISLILLSAACVDRVFIDVGNSPTFPIVVDGHISDEPGPYTIGITKAFDIESKVSLKIPISVKQVVLGDDHGNRETLSEVDQGIYQTKSTGIRGVVGNVYKLRIEISDGRVYESKPDTLFPPGNLDSVYHNFREDKTPDGASQYGFDVFFNASAGSKIDYHFLWKSIGTFQSDTNPEMACEGNPPVDCAPCTNDRPCGQCSICNFKPLCSGLRNYGKIPTYLNAVFVRVAPCECCTCWYNLFNPIPILSDNQLVGDGHYSAVKANYIPLNAWIFQHKVYIGVSQMSLSRQAFTFYNSIRTQKVAISSLFQPVTGKIPGNFVEINGSKVPIFGLFFATSITRKSISITRNDVHPQSLIPSVEIPWKNSCLTLFPNGTTTKPSYWKD